MTAPATAITDTKFKDFAGHYIEGLGRTLFNMKPHDLFKAIGIFQEASARGATIWLIGNGGSASLASHMATDFQLAGLRALALTDVAAITTAANDNSYEFSFVSPLDAVAKKGDVLLAISGSGNSPNIIRAAEWAKGKGCFVVGLTGFKGGKLAIASDHLIHCPADHMGRAQDAQQIALHVIAYYLMETGKEVVSA